MKSFSLRAVLLFVAFAALLLSHAHTSLQLREGQQEIAVIRRTYGHMKIEDATKINVISLAQDKRHGGDALRFVVPAGQRYFLNLSETTAEPVSDLPSGRHKTTVSLGWKEGKDIILRYGSYIDPEKQAPYIEVGSRNQGFFTYRPDDWPSGDQLDTTFQFDASEQTEVAIDEPIMLLRVLRAHQSGDPPVARVRVASECTTREKQELTLRFDTSKMHETGSSGRSVPLTNFKLETCPALGCHWATDPIAMQPLK